MVSAQGIILCQYVPCTDPVSCASHGVPRFYYAQVRGNIPSSPRPVLRPRPVCAASMHALSCVTVSSVATRVSQRRWLV